MKKKILDTNNELRIGWTFGCAMITMIFPPVIVVLLSQVLFNQNESASQILVGVLMTPIVIFMTAFILKKGFKKERLYFFDYLKKDSWKKALIGFALGTVLIGAQILILILMNQMQISYRGLGLIRLFAGFATFTGMAALEECVFRGIMDTGFSKFKLPIAFLISATFFTIAHQDLWMNFTIIRAIELFAAGLLFSLACRTTKSITLSTAMHLAFNYMGAVILGVDSENSLFHTVPTNGHNLLTGIDGGGSIIGIGVTIIFIIGFIYYGIKKQTLTFTPKLDE